MLQSKDHDAKVNACRVASRWFARCNRPQTRSVPIARDEGGVQGTLTRSRHRRQKIFSSELAPHYDWRHGRRHLVLGCRAADAYIALYPFLSKVTVPRGVGDLAKDLPRTDVTLLAPKASLVVRGDLNPAIQDLLLSAAVKIHSGVGIFQQAGRFPAAEGVDVPLSDEALPLLQSSFPFWIASLIGRLLVLLLPIVAVLYPIVRFLPALYDWVMRARIAQLYGELRFLGWECCGAGQCIGPC